MLNSTPFTNFSNSKSTITRKLSTNIQLEQRIYLHDLKERVPIFSIYKQNIGKTTQISTKKKENKFSRKLYTKNLIDPTTNNGQNNGRKKIYSKSFLNIVQTSITLKPII